jgi:hypothetical protein
MIIDFNHNELDDAIDERIAEFCKVSNNYGSSVVDKDARLVSSWEFDIQDNQLLSIIQQQQDQIRELSEYYHGTVVSQINKLWKEVQKL